MASVQTTRGRAHDARPRHMARYPDLAAARHAIEDLEAHGVDRNARDALEDTHPVELRAEPPVETHHPST